MLAERERYLTHLQQRGCSPTYIYDSAVWLPRVVERLCLSGPRIVSSDEIQEASKRWTERKPAVARKASASYSVCFSKFAKNWLRFLNLLQEPQVVTPFGDALEDFLSYLQVEKRYTRHAVGTSANRVVQFLRWVSVRHSELSSLGPEDISDYFAWLRSRNYSPFTISTDRTRVRIFLQYAEARGFVPRPISASMQRSSWPRVSPSLRGPKWSDVRRLLSLKTGDRPEDYRTRAIILFAAVYGLRAAEISSLRLDDFAWREGTFTVRRAKSGRIQRFPIMPEAITLVATYLSRARQPSKHRNLFVSMTRPYRPLSCNALWLSVSTRMKSLGIESQNRGTHALRHSCAVHLLDKGLGLQEIADFLGHSNTNSVLVYAKSSAVALKKVSEFRLGSNS
jgi:integrase/recombinase XerD